MSKKEALKQIAELVKQRHELGEQILKIKDEFIKENSPIQVGDTVIGNSMYKWKSKVTNITIGEDLGLNYSARIVFCRIKRNGELGDRNTAPMVWFQKVEVSK